MKPLTLGDINDEVVKREILDDTFDIEVKEGEDEHMVRLKIVYFVVVVVLSILFTFTATPLSTPVTPLPFDSINPPLP